MNLNELKAQRAEIFSAAETLVSNARMSGKDLSGEEQKQYEQHLSELKGLDSLIARCGCVGASAHSGNGFSPFITVNSARVNNPMGGMLHGAFSNLAGEQREQAIEFLNYLRPQNAANLVPSSDGGYIIPDFIVSTLERVYTAFAPVVSVARLWATETGSDVTFPVLSDSESAAQLAPAASTGADATVSGDTPPTALTGPTLHSWKVSSKPVYVPRETFTDSNVDILSEIVGALLARIIRFENLKFTKGVGTTEAEGFLANSTAYTIAHGSALDLDVALDLAYTVPALYRPQGVYMMSDTTVKYLRKIKSGISGDKQQLWADADATKGTPATLHGYPVIINNDMDDVAADGTFASKNPVAFGDFKRFVVRQAEMNRPFAYRYQVPAKDGVAVILFRRSDSKLLVPTAISKLAVAAS